ncbi:hypothetical protein Dsin_023873 [Dipteronia sinensis]|uniref:TF-B3 domain-containing protein n=1 Tax=Dipteronia sinensis TaxID=43782 RepID=A0AAE0A454_9ROSI|nr:hypothetical protein Dsin_023873 [Dipteronia sinensis]
MAMLRFEVSKKLVRSDILGNDIKLALPEQTVEHMKPIMNDSHFLDLKVVDARGQEWELHYYTRPNGKKKGPVFTTGWREFAGDKGLQVGDDITFSGHQVRADDGQLKMKFMIEVKRRTMTFNGAEPVTVDVERFELVPVNATAIMTFQGQPIIGNYN